MGFRLLLLKAIAGAGGANMCESGFKMDPNVSKVNNHHLTKYIVAKTAREKRRKILADRKAKKKCTSPESKVVSPVKESTVTQIAREKRRNIIAEKRAMRCYTSSAGFSNTVQRNQQTKTKQDKSSRPRHNKLQHETSESQGQKPKTENHTMNTKEK